MGWGEAQGPKRLGGSLHDLTDEDLAALLVGLAHVTSYNYVDVTELTLKIDKARALLRQERNT